MKRHTIDGCLPFQLIILGKGKGKGEGKGKEREKKNALPFV